MLTYISSTNGERNVDGATPQTSMALYHDNCNGNGQSGHFDCLGSINRVIIGGLNYLNKFINSDFKLSQSSVVYYCFPVETIHYTFM